MGLGKDRRRRVVAAAFLWAVVACGQPSRAVALSFPADGDTGDGPIHSVTPAGRMARQPGAWRIFETDRELLANRGGEFAGGEARADTMLASAYSGTWRIVPPWNAARQAGTVAIHDDAVRPPLNATALQASFYLLLAALMTAAAVGHFRSRRAPSR